jgi:predicted HicB family RNase H-like nuclease
VARKTKAGRTAVLSKHIHVRVTPAIHKALKRSATDREGSIQSLATELICIGMGRADLLEEPMMQSVSA